LFKRFYAFGIGVWVLLFVVAVFHSIPAQIRAAADLIKPPVTPFRIAIPEISGIHKAQKAPRFYVPQQPPLIINSPDPYVGTPNQTVAQWATDLADRLEKTGRKCGEDVVQAEQRKGLGTPVSLPDAPGPEFVQVMFRREFDEALKPAIIDTHRSLTFRLGPAKLDARVVGDYERIINFNNPPQRSWPLCMLIQDYAEGLRWMAQTLVSRH
jgi:hypothetical protein